MKKALLLFTIAVICLVSSSFVLAKDTLVLWDIRTESDNSTPAVLDAIARFERLIILV